LSIVSALLTVAAGLYMALLMAAVMIGIVFLMTTKPALMGSIIAMAVFLVLGLASGLPLWRSARGHRA
jgi:hypothetical protein